MIINRLNKITFIADISIKELNGILVPESFIIIGLIGYDQFLLYSVFNLQISKKDEMVILD